MFIFPYIWLSKGNLQISQNHKHLKKVINKFQTNLEKFYSTLNEQLITNGTELVVGDY